MKRLFPFVLLVLASLANAVAGCKKDPSPPPTAQCAAGCAHLRELPDTKDPSKPCALSEPTVEGVTCEQWCGSSGNPDRVHGVDPVCFEHAATCKAAERCVR